MSIQGAALTSWPIRAIGKSGAKSSGPTGCLVAGCRGGSSGVDRCGATLNHAVGDLIGGQVPTHGRPPVSGPPLGTALWLREHRAKAPGRAEGPWD